MATTELVTTLKRNATRLIANVQKSKEPVLITQHGLPSAYLVDVKSFDALRARMELLEGIARGEMAIRDGRVLSHEQAKKKLKRWLK
jgi:prevent-host-death family protein